MNNYYTYAYLREDGTPYYIGKGSGKRIYDSKGRPCKKPKDKSKIIFLKQNLTEEEAFKHEIYMIVVFGRKDLGTGILHNRTDGGDGSSGAVRSLELRKKISESMKGRTFTEEHLKKISASNKGKTLSEDVKRKLSEKNKGKKLTDETKEKMRNSLKKRWENGDFTGTTGMKLKKRKPSNLKTFYLTSPENIVYTATRGLRNFCEDHSISYNTMYYGLHYKNGNATNGWKIVNVSLCSSIE